MQQSFGCTGLYLKFWMVCRRRDSGGDEGVDEGSCSREGERWGESVNVLEVKEGGSAVIVKDDSKV